MSGHHYNCGELNIFFLVHISQKSFNFEHFLIFSNLDILYDVTVYFLENIEKAAMAVWCYLCRALIHFSETKT